MGGPISDAVPDPGQTLVAEDELVHLRKELESVRAERDSLLIREQLIVELIGARDSSKLIHDLRNVLNERELLRTLANGQL